MVSLFLTVLVTVGSFDSFAVPPAKCTASCPNGTSISCTGTSCTCSDGTCGGTATCSCDDFWSEIACNCN